MIDRFLRRLTVRSRIIGGFVILVALSALSLPVIVINQNFLVNRLRQLTDVEARADRALLLASARIESSRVNTMRYIQDYAPSTYEALDDVDQASKLLTDARSLIAAPEQQAAVDTVLAALVDYRSLIQDVETARSAAEEGDVSRLLFQAYRLGNDIGQRIEQIVSDSETRMAAANQATYAEVQNRLILVASAYVVALILALLLAGLIQRSITRPVADLRRGAEAFRQGQMDVTIPVVGSDELSLLGRAFNQLVAQLRELIGSLEQRVADRTHELERRAMQLATAADVSRAAASILDLEPLTRRVAESVRERFDLYYTGLFLLDAQGRYAVLEAGTGEAGEAMKNQGHKLEVDGVSMVGAACAQRQARIALDVGDEPVRFDNPLLPLTRSEMALPLVVGSIVLGALDVQSTKPAAFSEEDIAVLQLVADQVAVAIQNAKLFAEVQVSLEAERRAYGEISQEAWTQLIQTRGASLGYTSDEQGISPASQVTEAHSRAAMRAGRVVAGSDGASALAVPIRVRDRVIGVIDAEKPMGAGAWTAQETALLEALIDQLGIALEGARLYEDTLYRAVQERLLAQVAARMRETLDVRTVLETAADELYQALSLDKVVIHLAGESDHG
jgi:GAF domain-containing protein/HAMP domain-containing protein